MRPRPAELVTALGLCLGVSLGSAHAQAPALPPGPGDPPPPSEATQPRQGPPPVENRVGTAPPRPRFDEEFDARLQRLWTAILADDPALATEVFFPQLAFRRVKAASAPDRIHRRLVREFEEDIHHLHQQVPANAVLVGFRPRRCSWTRRGEEANALPYWSCRHNHIRYRVGERERRVELRTLINWGPRWYVTHLAQR